MKGEKKGKKGRERKENDVSYFSSFSDIELDSPVKGQGRKDIKRKKGESCRNKEGGGGGGKGERKK